MNSNNNLRCKCCRLSHFDYVKSEDLERIGMGKPAIRRLVDAVKKRNRKKNLFDKVIFTIINSKLVMHRTVSYLWPYLTYKLTDAVLQLSECRIICTISD